MFTIFSRPQRVSAVLLALMAFGSTALQASAELQQKTVTGPIVLRFYNALNSANVTVGDPFKATVTETSCYQGSCINKGTMLSGFVMEAKSSRKIHRPGYMDLQVVSVDYPDGRHLRYQDTNTKRNIRLMSPEAYTVKDQLVEQVPSLLGATAVVVPLALASSLTAGAIIPLGFAGAIIASGIQEGIQTRRGLAHGSPLERTGRVVARGTVLPYVGYKATQLSPEAAVNVGDAVALRPGARFAREMYGLK
jgi:hypothetical protein